jgi:alcohol dehydrogenase class IV
MGAKGPSHRFSVPIPMRFGAGALAELGEALAERGIERPLFVTDRGLKVCGLVDRVLESLGARRAGAVVFDGVSANPREEDVLAARDLYRSADRDGIVALGGGSAIDAAKGLRVMAAASGSLTDYDLRGGGPSARLPPLPPLIAVPTTAGTGSEVSRGALIITRRGAVLRKTTIVVPGLTPSAAILDPELTLGLPRALIAGCAMDALTHSFEEWLSPRFHPVVAAIAIDAASRIARALPQVWRDPGDLDQRAELLLASMMAGIGFEKGLGVVHSLSHAIGALHDRLHHGTLNAVLLPAAIEFNRRHSAPGALRELARRLDLPAESDSGAADRLIDWLRGLNRELAIPERLRGLADLERDRGEILDRALEDHCHRTNPRPCARSDLEELWELAY